MAKDVTQRRGFRWALRLHTRESRVRSSREASEDAMRGNVLQSWTPAWLVLTAPPMEG